MEWNKNAWVANWELCLKPNWPLVCSLAVKRRFWWPAPFLMMCGNAWSYIRAAVKLNLLGRVRMKHLADESYILFLSILCVFALICTRYVYEMSTNAIKCLKQRLDVQSPRMLPNTSELHSCCRSRGTFILFFWTDTWKLKPLTPYSDSINFHSLRENVMFVFHYSVVLFSFVVVVFTVIYSSWLCQRAAHSDSD